MTNYEKLSKNFYADNVLNINSERYYREAEDYFFYYDKAGKAISKLKKALELTPIHIKSLKLLGDIYFTNGKIDLAFDSYSQAAALKPDDATALASLASILEAKGSFKTALDFTELAFKHLTNADIRLFAPLSELKVSLLINLRKYKEAEGFLEATKRRLPFEEVEKFAPAKHEILKKKLAIRERMSNLNIKVV